MIILDTNVISEIMRPEPAVPVIVWLKQQPLPELAITAVSVAEIRYGLSRLPDGRKRNALQEKFLSFLSRGFQNRIMPFDGHAADIYGAIVADREQSGRPIDAFDAMIAAIARIHQADVATRDVGGFEGCGINIINPFLES